MTANDIIARALKTIGVLGAGQTASGDDASDALDTLNELVDSWATQRWISYFLVRTVKTLAASTASYTVGSGGSINIVRPVSISYANLILDSSASTTTEVPLKVFTPEEWQAIAQKSLTAALSSGIYYDYGWTAGLGIIYPWPIPNVGTTQLVLYTPQAVTEFADLGTDYTFPPGYERAFRLNLARELAAGFGVAAQWTPPLEMAANDALADIKRTNFRPEELRLDPALCGHGHVYNIESDQ